MARGTNIIICSNSIAELKMRKLGRWIADWSGVGVEDKSLLRERPEQR